MTKYVWTEHEPTPTYYKSHKLYKVVKEYSNRWFNVVADDGQEHSALSDNCAHLPGNAGWNVFETDLEIGDKVEGIHFGQKLTVKGFLVSPVFNQVTVWVMDRDEKWHSSSPKHIYKALDQKETKPMSKFVTTETKVVKTIPERVKFSDNRIVSFSKNALGNAITINSQGYYYNSKDLRELAAGLLEIADALEGK